jgi:glycosyltransferase involved in cell wall biosynthesis
MKPSRETNAAPSKYPRVLIMAFPFVSASILTPVCQMARVISTISSDTILLGNKLYDSKNILPPEVKIIPLKASLQYANRKHPIIYSIFRWAVMMIQAQMELGWRLWTLHNEIDIVVCTLGSYYQIPCLLSKLLNKKLICSSFGVDSNIALINHGRFVSTILFLFSLFNFSLSDKIIVDCTETIEYPALKPFSHKIILGHLYMDDAFYISVPFNRRHTNIGFIGRVSKEKGILDFAQALPTFLERNRDAKVIIIGSGSIDEILETKLKRINLPNRINWIKWVSHTEIPFYLNNLRLLVLPSYTEGSPNVVLEALACGTPVLATNVGGIPSLIKDKESGFILKNTSPTEISQAISMALSNPELQRIIINGRKIIEEEYSFHACEERYRNIIL